MKSSLVEAFCRGVPVLSITQPSLSLVFLALVMCLNQEFGLRISESMRWLYRWRSTWERYSGNYCNISTEWKNVHYVFCVWSLCLITGWKSTLQTFMRLTFCVESIYASWCPCQFSGQDFLCPVILLTWANLVCIPVDQTSVHVIIFRICLSMHRGESALSLRVPSKLFELQFKCSIWPTSKVHIGSS